MSEFFPQPSDVALSQAAPQGVQDPSVAVQTPAAATGASAAPNAPLAGSIMQSTQVANKINPGDWRENLIAGVTNALSGFAPKREAPVGAGIFSGIGQASQEMQQRKQQQIQNQMEQKKIVMAQQNQDREYQIKLAEMAPTIAETDARTALNTAQAERMGVESIKDQIELSRPLIAKAEDQGLVDQSGATQADLLAGLKSGKYHPGETLGPVDGFTTITGPDGKEKIEATHTVLKNATEPVPLTQEDVDRFKANHVPGFENMSTITPSQTMPLGQYGLATQQAGSNKLFETTLSDVHDTLGTKAGADPLSQPGMVPAAQKFSHYIAAAGGDPFKALMAMSSQTKIDPKTGASIANPDAPSAQKLVEAFGGWPALHQYETIQEARLKDESGLTADKAITISTAPAGQYTTAQVKQANDFLKISNKQKLDGQLSEFAAEGKGTEQMYKYGKDPSSGEKLTLENAPGEFLVNERTGQPIPTSMMTVLKPSMQETNRGDFAGSVLHSLDLIDNLKKEGKLPNGPMSGVTAANLAKAGLGGDSQEAIDLLKFAQSAATGAHVGGRFSKEIMQKMDTMIALNMNDTQFAAAERGIRDVMEQYAQQGGRMTVDQYRQKKLDDQQTAAEATPQTHQFSVSAWQAAHPGQKPDATVAAMKQKGFTVTQ